MSNDIATDKVLPKIVIGSGTVDLASFNEELENAGKETFRSMRKNRTRQVSVKRRAANFDKELNS